MSEEVRRDQAVQALDEIRTRQRQVVTAPVIPNWYWSAVGALMVVFSIGVESRRAVLIGVCTTVFVVGLNATIWVVVLRARAGIRRRYLGPAGLGLIGAFVGSLVALGLATGFGLAALGFRWPATGGDAVVAVALALGGPWLMRRLRAVMTARADAALDAAR